MRERTLQERFFLAAAAPSCYNGERKQRAAVQPGTREGMNMEQADNLLGRIRKNYHSFSKGQKRLADYITENYDKAVFLTAARLGKSFRGRDILAYAEKCGAGSTRYELIQC